MEFYEIESINRAVESLLSNVKGKCCYSQVFVLQILKTVMDYYIQKSHQEA